MSDVHEKREAMLIDLSVHGSKCNCNHCREDVGAEMDVLNHHGLLWDYYYGESPHSNC